MVCSPRLRERFTFQCQGDVYEFNASECGRLAAQEIISFWMALREGKAVAGRVSVVGGALVFFDFAAHFSLWARISRQC